MGPMDRGQDSQEAPKMRVVACPVTQVAEGLGEG